MGTTGRDRESRYCSRFCVDALQTNGVTASLEADMKGRKTDAEQSGDIVSPSVRSSRPEHHEDLEEVA